MSLHLRPFSNDEWSEEIRQVITMLQLNELRRFIRRAQKKIETLDPFCDESNRVMALAIVSEVSSSLNIEVQSGARSCILTGWPRTGKTFIAGKVAKSGGVVCIPLDPLRKLWYPVPDPSLRVQMRRRIIETLLCRYPRGVLIEGDDLISLDRAEGTGIGELSLGLVESLATRHRVDGFVIGNATASMEDKIHSLEEYRKTGKCWTLKPDRSWNEKEIASFAQRTIKGSRQLQKMALDAGITYIEMDVQNFEASVNEAAQRILEQISIHS